MDTRCFREVHYLKPASVLKLPPRDEFLELVSNHLNPFSVRVNSFV